MCLLGRWMPNRKGWLTMCGSMKRVFCGAGVLTMLLAVCLPGWSKESGDGHAQDTLHLKLKYIDSFTLTDQDGNAFSSDQLLGKVWVAHFFYIACKECRKSVPAISELQQLIRGKPDLVIVSISLNEDSPEDLKRYSQDWGAVPGQWLFLTGKKNVVHDLFQKSFLQSVREVPKADPDSVIEHDKKLVVVDRQGFFQGYINRDDESAIDLLLPRMRELAGARYRLSAFNAALNLGSAVFLTLGYVAIRRRWIKLHKIFMLTALTTSTVFLASYLYYHFVVLARQPPRFVGVGVVWYVYFGMLLSHTILAVVAAPLALTVTYLGLRDRLARHVRLARWTLPIWLYVSVTGVLVYWMLYQMYPRY